MPLYVRNKISIAGPAEDIDEIRSMVFRAIATEGNGFESMSSGLFYQVVQIPAELIEIRNDSYVSMLRDGEAADYVRTLVGRETKGLLHDEIIGNLENSLKCRESYGYYTWQDFASDKWGCRSNPENVCCIMHKNNAIVFCFRTVCSAPFQYVKQLSFRFPECRISIISANEISHGGGGARAVYRNGSRMRCRDIPYCSDRMWSFFIGQEESLFNKARVSD